MAYLIVAGCRFSKYLAGFGGATTSRLVLLDDSDLSVRGDPSALVKKTIIKGNKEPHIAF